MTNLLSRGECLRIEHLVSPEKGREERRTVCSIPFIAEGRWDFKVEKRERSKALDNSDGDSSLQVNGETVPSLCAVGNSDRRKRDMTDDAPVHFRHQREGECIGLPQCG